MAAKNPTPGRYVPSVIPSLPDSLPAFLGRELRGIGTVVDGLLDYLPRDALAAPDNPRSGMVRRAVSPWRPAPGQTADEWVQFDGTSWDRLNRPSGFRNLLHNGLFRVNQRGAGVVTTNNGWICDRWRHLDDATGARAASVFPLSDADRAAIGDEFVAKAVNVNTTTAPNAVTGYELLAHNIEGVRTLAGKTATISFWAIAAAPTSVAVELGQSFGTGGSPSATVTGIGAAKLNLTTSWARYSATFTVPSIAGKTLGTDGNDYLYLFLWSSGGSSFASRTGGLTAVTNNVSFTGVQIDEGPIATPLEKLPLAVELLICQRFYQTTALYNTLTSAAAGNYIAAATSFPPMRAVPTVVLGSNSNANINTPTVVASTSTPIVVAFATTVGTGTTTLNQTVNLSADL